MSLSAGAQLGPYEILSPIGAGGMGEVWKARDTRIDRSVAIKLMKREFADHFSREAKAISALNHPNICTLYDLGVHEENSYLVMEFLEGTPLRGPLPWEQARTYALQLLEALETAHRAGVVHRDVKPANIVLTKSGVKLVDFGLAKARPAALSQVDATLTQVDNTIQGTPHYMAPEQATGGEIDSRADIFAFGAVLYEMLTGKRAFAGDNVAEVISRVMKDDPLREPLAPSVPLSVTKILARCLSKDPERRYQSARDVALDLQEAAFDPAATVSRRRGFLIGTSLASLGVLAGAYVGSRGQKTQTGKSYHLTIPMPDGHRLASASAPISPDGMTVTFATIDGTGRRFYWIRRLGEHAPKALEGTGTPVSATWAPDSRSLVFAGDSAIMRAHLDSFSIETISSFGANALIWCGDGNLIARRGSELFRLTVPGGRMVRLNISARTMVGLRDLHHHGRFLIRTAINQQRYDYIAIDLEGNELGRVVEGVNDCQYGGGFLFYSDAENRWQARAFDPGSLSFTNAAVHTVNIGQANGVRVSQNRDLSYVVSERRTEERLITRESGASTPLDVGSHPEFSADGKRVLSVASDSNIWLLDIERGAKTKLTFDGGGVAVWSHDESRIYFSGRGEEGAGVYVMPASGGQKRELFINGETHHLHVSPDGKYIVATLRSKGGLDLVAIGIQDRKVRVISDRPGYYDQPQVSPDSRWLAYCSDETGRMETYITAFPGGGARWAVSTEGGGLGRWRHDGRELYYPDRELSLYAVDVDGSGSQPKLGKPRKILELTRRIPGSARYAVTPDGKRVLMPFQVTGSRTPELHIVTNWQPPSMNSGG